MIIDCIVQLEYCVVLYTIHKIYTLTMGNGKVQDDHDVFLSTLLAHICISLHNIIADIINHFKYKSIQKLLCVRLRNRILKSCLV